MAYFFGKLRAIVIFGGIGVFLGIQITLFVFHNIFSLLCHKWGKIDSTFWGYFLRSKIWFMRENFHFARFLKARIKLQDNDVATKGTCLFLFIYLIQPCEGWSDQYFFFFLLSTWGSKKGFFAALLSFYLYQLDWCERELLLRNSF